MGERPAEGQERSGGDAGCMERLKDEFRVKNFGLSHPNPRLFVSSQWGDWPTFYLVWRVFWALFHVGWILYNWVDDAENAKRTGSWLIFLTNWGYLMLTVDTVLLALQQVYVTCARKQLLDMPWYIKATWVVYNIASVASLMITVLYYALLFSGDWMLLGTITHLVTSVYVILDLAVTATPVRLFHVIHTLIFAGLYLAFNVIYWAAGGVNDDGEPYIYEPLDWRNPEKAAPLAVGVLVVGVPLMHLVLWSLYMLRVCVWGCVRKGDDSKSNDHELRPI